MDNERKINIELTPYDALALLSFITEMLHGCNPKETRLTAILQAKENFFNEIAAKTTPDDLENCYVQREVNILLGKEPDLEDNGQRT